MAQNEKAVSNEYMGFYVKEEFVSKENIQLQLADGNDQVMRIFQGAEESNEAIKENTKQANYEELYAGHVVKEEVVTGPEVLHRPCAPLPSENTCEGAVCFTELSSHVSGISSESYICTKCEYETVNKETLQKHLELHKPMGEFDCDPCELREDPGYRKRVRFSQLETLLDFLQSHKEVAVGFNKSAQAREHSRRCWTRIADTLNAHSDGAVKDWRSWAKYWVDYKAKLKRRAAAVRSAHVRTGGGPSADHPLTEIEKKFLLIVGENSGSGVPGVRVDPLDGATYESAAEVLGSAAFVEGPNSESIEIPDSPLRNVAPTLDIESNVEIPTDIHIGRANAPIASTSSVQQANGNIGPQRRRRRRRRISTTAAEARRMLLDSSERRAAMEERLVDCVERISGTLSSINQCLERIERRFSSTMASE